jgi:hypothetical protein
VRFIITMMLGWVTTLSLCGSCHRGLKEFKVLLAREDKTACKVCREFKVLLVPEDKMVCRVCKVLTGRRDPPAHRGLHLHRSIYSQ